jgi:hypothetical protein
MERVGSSRTRRVDVRILSATNADLAAEVAAGRFRRDLLFRLNTIEIRVPPLRERRRGHPAAGRALPERARPALPQEGRGLRRRRRAGAARASVARQRARARPRGRAVGADGARAIVHAADLALRAEQRRSASLEEMSLEQVESLLIRRRSRASAATSARPPRRSA